MLIPYNMYFLSVGNGKYRYLRIGVQEYEDPFNLPWLNLKFDKLDLKFQDTIFHNYSNTI